MYSPAEWERRFPKFVLADDDSGETFIIHLHFPRFVGRVTGLYFPEARLDPEFIDEAQGLSISGVTELLRQAGQFYNDEMCRRAQPELPAAAPDWPADRRPVEEGAHPQTAKHA